VDRPLSDVQLEPDQVLLNGFEAVFHGERVTVTAVLERTCVYVGRGGERKLANKRDLLVEPEQLPIYHYDNRPDDDT
jgi:hypothetical protein